MLFRYMSLRQVMNLMVIGYSLLTAACGTTVNPSSLVASPTPEVVATRWTAELIGELVVVNDCLRVKAENIETSYLLAWPPDFDVKIEGDTVQVTDRLYGETITWHVGDTVQVSGGETSSLDEPLRQRLPANCSGPYWISGGWLRQTPSLTESPIRPTPTPAPAEVSGVKLARLLNAQQGWALAGRDLFWTDDAGQSWRRMTPDMSDEASLGNAYYLDPQQAWVLMCESQSSDSVFKVAHTTDGGNNWEISELASVAQLTSYADNQWCGRGNPGQIIFLDAQQGWVMIDHTVTMNSRVGEMFQTSDGGQTWQRLGTSPSGEFRFVSRTVGWMRATCCTGGAFQLYRTEDGGKTWQVELVSGSGEDDDFFLPAFFGQQEGLLPVVLRDEGVPQEGITFFKTRNGGRTWEPIGKLAVVSDSLNIGSAGDVQVVNDQTWVVALPGSGVYWTTDGDQHWSENTNQIARSILRLALGSATSGWGLQCNEGSAPECVRLVGTEDRGAHWEYIPIKP